MNPLKFIQAAVKKTRSGIFTTVLGGSRVTFVVDTGSVFDVLRQKDTLTTKENIEDIMVKFGMSPKSVHHYDEVQAFKDIKVNLMGDEPVNELTNRFQSYLFSLLPLRRDPPYSGTSTDGKWLQCELFQFVSDLVLPAACAALMGEK